MIDVGEVLWIHPHQWRRASNPNGFPYRAVAILGVDGADPSQVWVRGVALDGDTGVPVQEIVLKLPVDQPRSQQVRILDAEPQTSPPPPAPAATREWIRPYVQVGARHYRRTL